MIDADDVLLQMKLEPRELAALKASRWAVVWQLWELVEDNDSATTAQVMLASDKILGTETDVTLN